MIYIPPLYTSRGYYYTGKIDNTLTNIYNYKKQFIEGGLYVRKKYITGCYFQTASLL